VLDVVDHDLAHPDLHPRMLPRGIAAPTPRQLITEIWDPPSARLSAAAAPRSIAVDVQVRRAHCAAVIGIDD